MNILKERERADERNEYDFRTDYYTARREDAFERSMRDRGYDDLRTDYSRRDDLDRRGYSDRRYDMADLGARRDYDVRERDCDGRGREYEDYTAPRYDYRDSYRSDDDSEYRYEQRSSFSPIEYSAPAQAKKTVRHAKSKFLIAVYFLLVALIASLVITNVVMFNEEPVVEAETAAETSEEVIFATVTEDGTTESLTTDRLTGYEYDTTTNWFDRFCDMLSR